MARAASTKSSRLSDRICPRTTRANTGQGEDANRHDYIAITYAQDGDDHDCQQELRKGQQQVEQPHQQIVQPAAPVPSRQADANPSEQSEADAKQTHRERDPRAVQHATEDVAAEVVRSKRMGQ